MFSTSAGNILVANVSQPSLPTKGAHLISRCRYFVESSFAARRNAGAPRSVYACGVGMVSEVKLTWRWGSSWNVLKEKWCHNVKEIVFRVMLTYSCKINNISLLPQTHQPLRQHKLTEASWACSPQSSSKARGGKSPPCQHRQILRGLMKWGRLWRESTLLEHNNAVCLTGRWSVSASCIAFHVAMTAASGFIYIPHKKRKAWGKTVARLSTEVLKYMIVNF